MEESRFNELLEQLKLFIFDVIDLPLEDLIKQLNNMLKHPEKYNSDTYTREMLSNYVMVTNGFLAMKSSLLMNENLFKEF